MWGLMNLGDRGPLNMYVLRIRTEWRSRSLGMDRINSSLSLSPAFYIGMYAMQAGQHTFDKIPLSST